MNPVTLSSKSFLSGAVLSLCVACLALIAARGDEPPKTSPCCNDDVSEVAEKTHAHEPLATTPNACCTEIAAVAKECCQASEPVSGGATQNVVSGLVIPDVTLLDQDGTPVHLPGLIKDKVVAISFVFTTCTTICPPLTANFAQVQKLIGARQDFHLITISIDPVKDSPQRLKAFSRQFGAAPGWTFLTGTKTDVEKALKALGAFVSVKENHSPLVLIGSSSRQEWTRVNGLASPAKLVEVAMNMLGNDTENRRHADPQPASASPAQNYFSDVELLNHEGQSMRFYSDLIQGKVVVINTFFAECAGVCPLLNKNIEAIQDAVWDQLGSNVHLISITVDPRNDTPEKLREYAKQFHAQPGWHFVTGSEENLRLALSKLGMNVADREAHANTIIIGNDRTGLWKKAFGLAQEDELIRIVESVLHDSGS
jgi:protein SCO1